MENEKEIPKKAPEAPKKVSVIQTYAEDMAHAMDNAQGGLIKKIIEEQEQAGKEEENLSPESKKNKTLMLVSVILILVAIILVGVMLFLSMKPTPTVEVQQSKSLIYIDQSTFLPIDNLTKEQITQTVKNEALLTKVKSGGVEAIYLTENKQVIGLRRFLELIKVALPDAVAADTNDSFMIGTFNGEKKGLFILLKVRSFTDIFPSLKSWENKLFNDIHDLFGIDITTANNYLLTKDFDDGVIGNKNARILHTTAGDDVFGYVFADETSVVVIADKAAANEVMLRLAASGLKKI